MQQLSFVWTCRRVYRLKLAVPHLELGMSKSADIARSGMLLMLLGGFLAGAGWISSSLMARSGGGALEAVIGTSGALVAFTGAIMLSIGIHRALVKIDALPDPATRKGQANGHMGSSGGGESGEAN